MPSPALRIHFHPASYNARRTLAVAFHVGAPVEVVICDLMSGAQGSPEFRALNPNGLVPVLEDGDFVLWESMAITQYLAEKYPSSMWPADARIRADITRWQAWDLAHFGRAADVLLIVAEHYSRGAPTETIATPKNGTTRKMSWTSQQRVGRQQFQAGHAG